MKAFERTTTFYITDRYGLKDEEKVSKTGKEKRRERRKRKKE